MSETLLERLSHSPLGLAGPTVVQWLAPHFVHRQVSKGTMVFVEGDTGGRFFVVNSGRLKAFRNLPGGRSITVFSLSDGDFFGFIPLLDGGPYPVSVSAVEPSELFVLSRDDFQRVMAEHPEICPALLTYTARRLRESLDHIGRLGHKGAVSRTAHALVSFVAAASKYSGSAEVTLPSSQKDLARTLDITPENLSRAFARLCEQRAIQRTGPRRFVILDIEMLAAVAESSATDC